MLSYVKADHPEIDIFNGIFRNTTLNGRRPPNEKRREHLHSPGNNSPAFYPPLRLRVTDRDVCLVQRPIQVPNNPASPVHFWPINWVFERTSDTPMIISRRVFIVFSEKMSNNVEFIPKSNSCMPCLNVSTRPHSRSEPAFWHFHPRWRARYIFFFSQTIHWETTSWIKQWIVTKRRYQWPLSFQSSRFTPERPLSSSWCWVQKLINDHFERSRRKQHLRDVSEAVFEKAGVMAILDCWVWEGVSETSCFSFVPDGDE